MVQIEVAIESDKTCIKAHKRLAQEGYKAFHNDKELSITTLKQTSQLSRFGRETHDFSFDVTTAC